MVDPTTVNKFLAQPTRGSDVGTWDTPMNGNSGIVDNSFGGVTTIALTNSPVSLSSAQYQCVFLVFTGALSGNCAITFPSVGSFYTVQNLTSNTSSFRVTALTTAAGGQTIGLPPGEACDIFTDGTNVKYRSLGRIGSYWDYAGTTVPAWVTDCSVPPYLKCDGTSFSSATYPILTTIMGGTTLPDSKGRGRISLDEGVGRVSSGVSGVPGNTLFGAGGDQNMQQHNHTGVTDNPTTHPNVGSPAPPSWLQAAPGGGTGWEGTASPVQPTLPDHVHTFTSSNAGTGVAQNMPPVYVGGITMVRAA